MKVWVSICVAAIALFPGARVCAGEEAARQYVLQIEGMT
jgi:hypothetical protein